MRVLPLLLLLAGFLASARASAKTATDAPAEPGIPVAKVPDTSTTTEPSLEQPNAEKDKTNTRYWSSGRNRPFASATIDAGYLYFRPRLSLGYGRPFVKWIGIDLNPVVSNRFLGGYGGIRMALPLVDLRVGARYTWAFQQYFLTPLAAYHRLDFEAQDLQRSQYVSLEAELSGGVPVGPGSILAVLSGTMVTGAPAGVLVYEETLRVILKPPYVALGRLGYVVRLGVEGKVSFGVVADVLTMPGRDDYVFRAGIIGSAQLSDHVEVLGSLIPPIISPDSIGIPGGDFAQLGIRYRWASGSPPDPILPPALP